MFEILKSDPTIIIGLIFIAYLAGASTMFAAIMTYVVHEDTKIYGAADSEPLPTKNRMEMYADRDKVAEALSVIN